MEPLPFHTRRALLTSMAATMATSQPKPVAPKPIAPQPSTQTFAPPASGPLSLVDIGRGFKMAPNAASSFKTMAADAAKEGVDLFGINNTYRSVALQSQLFQKALAKYGSEQAARKWVAPPGRSKHNVGLAVDFSSRPAAAWMKGKGTNYGWHNYAPEWWHYSYKGT